MKAVVFINSLTLGGTEKAACAWAQYLAFRAKESHLNAPSIIHNPQSSLPHPSFSISSLSALSLADGPRRANLERSGIPLTTFPPSHLPTAEELAEFLRDTDVIHAHAPGFPHQGDLLGKTISLLGRKIPVVQTNIFGKLENPAEEEWTDFRLFISWTSCVQAARRAGRKLDLEFFRRQSVAPYPVEAVDSSAVEKLKVESEKLRSKLGLNPENILFGRFSRPEPNKWTPLVLDAFLAAWKENPDIRLLLREPPPEVASDLESRGLAVIYSCSPTSLSRDSDFRLPTSDSSRPPPILILPATADPHELAVSQMACDVILHTSSIGESFGYGIAEPMALGKPVITNSVPWHDQAQIELVRHGECGLIASTLPSMKKAILQMASLHQSKISHQQLHSISPVSKLSLSKMGENARRHILSLADPGESTDRVAMAMECALGNRDNPFAAQDLEKALQTADYLDQHQWGHSWEEQLWLRGKNAKVNFLRWQRKLRNWFFGKKAEKLTN